jgi:hypothetical protein
MMSALVLVIDGTMANPCFVDKGTDIVFYYINIQPGVHTKRWLNIENDTYDRNQELGKK